MFEQVLKRNPSQFECQKGCYGCCQAGLTISNVEASHIRDWLESNKSVSEKIRDADQMLSDESHCPLLDKDGLCSIYEARPMICRSHGMPVSWVREETDDDGITIEQRDACPLNFKGVNLDSLESSEVLSLDKLNTLLSLINRQFDEANADKRVALNELIGAL